MNRYEKLSFVELFDNRVPVYYAGGSNINSFRNLEIGKDGPEDWVGSTCCLPASILPQNYPSNTGVSKTLYGPLDELIASDPVWWLGEFVSKHYGGDLPLLVKLLDAGERLPVHAHPSIDFAGKHLRSKYGKTEAWIVISAEPESKVWLGLTSTQSKEEFRSLVLKQDVNTMLSCMNQMSVKSGDIIYVPAGTLHSIGAGVFLIELQEPTSYSILCEYQNFGVTENAATLGLGWELALDAVNLEESNHFSRTLFCEEREILRSENFFLTTLFPQKSDIYFRAQRLRATGSGSVPLDSIAIMVVESGEGAFQFEGKSFEFKKGMTFAVPAGVRQFTFVGDFELVLCLPPKRD